jgi:hypothetical protein
MEDSPHQRPSSDPVVPVSKFAGPRASWKSLWNRSRGDQPEITTIYAAKAQYVSTARPLCNLGHLTQQSASHT